MNNPLTPVQVLDQTIEQLKEHIKRVNKLSIDDVMGIQFLAALELAKAYAMLEASEKWTQSLAEAEKTAFKNLIEVLRR